MSKTKTIYLFILLMIVIAFAACEKSTSISVTNTFTPTPTVVDTPTPTPTLSPANMITATPTDRITSTATPTVPPITEADMEESPVEDKVTNKLIAIDAGHQKKGNYEEEPIGPGATATKPKVSSGTEGAFTGVAEYELTLIIASKLKEELINRGYDVYMIREIHEVNLSNKERAEMANESGADLFLRIHADGSTNSDVNGASTLYPSEDNPYVPDLSISSYSLSKSVIDSLCEETGAKNRGAIARDDMSGINWCTLPVTIIEVGYMSNQTEDELMQTKDYQNKIVQGICNGIDTYNENQ